MRKKVSKIVCGIIACVLVVCAVIPFSACGFDNAVKKASKNLTTYTITAAYDDTTKTISAEEKVSYLNTSGVALSELFFHLYPRAFREDAAIKPYTALTQARCFPNEISYGDINLTSVKVAGQNSPVVFDGEDENVLKIVLSTPLENGKRVMIDMSFLVTIPNCQHRLGYFENNVNLGNWFPIACEYSGGEFDKTAYYATGDPFNSSCANFNVEFCCDSGFVLASSGIVKKVTNSGNKSVYKIEGRAIRDFAITLGKNFKKVTDKVGSTTINYFGYKDDADIAENLKTACRAVAFFNDTFGTYPYRVLNVAKTPFMHGGMEYPNFVTISDTVTDSPEVKKVIVHEIAHQWWYGLCGNNEVVDAWFDEGLSEYSTFLFMQKYPEICGNYAEQVEDAKMGYELYLEVFDAIDIAVKKQMDLAIFDYSNEYEYTYMVYVKGALMFDKIAETIGPKKLVTCLKKTLKKYRFKKVDKNTFLQMLPQKAHSIFNDYMSGKF